MMSPASLLVLASILLPTVFQAAQAAEALNNKAMERTYIPESTPCLPDKAKPRDCAKPAVGSLEDQTLRDAEQQNVRQQLGNPNLNNPDTLPPPTQLPPPDFLPERQQLIEQIRHLPGPP